MKKKIALIEDDKILSDALYGGLIDAGFEVLRAFDGEESLTLVTSQKPDLLLLDLMLPKLDGLTVARRLKSAPETKNIPIIILTAVEKPEPIAEALANNVYEYMVKSDFTVDQIVAKVKEKLISA